MVLEAVRSYGQALKFVDEQLHLGLTIPGFNMFQHLVDPYIPTKMGYRNNETKMGINQ